MKVLKIKNNISIKHKTYFIADIAANHDVNCLGQKLIRLAAAEQMLWKLKFFAKNFISDYGFKSLGKKNLINQIGGSVYDVSKMNSFSWTWT